MATSPSPNGNRGSKDDRGAGESPFPFRSIFSQRSLLLTLTPGKEVGQLVVDRVGESYKLRVVSKRSDK